ncbi:MAG: aminoacyl-tRNA hydrolase [Spirochaetia bacterium]|jgi:PTH1 family peptidyl-tRNA hydrolase|nr:aminoacyl-tRNA hydrolase [Spirochaetia bacterium]
MIKMTVFVGNPGKEYEKTRHNIGWMVLDALAGSVGLNWKKKFNGQWTDYSVGSNKIIFLKPETFVNNTGKSAQAAAHFFKIKPEEIILVHDDLELDFEKIVLKKGGGTGGHNGLRSMNQHLGTSEYYRLRLGISRPVHGSVSSHVLGRFSPDEEIGLQTFVPRAVEVFEDILRITLDTAITKYGIGK